MVMQIDQIIRKHQQLLSDDQHIFKEFSQYEHHSSECQDKIGKNIASNNFNIVKISKLTAYVLKRNCHLIPPAHGIQY